MTSTNTDKPKRSGNGRPQYSAEELARARNNPTSLLPEKIIHEEIAYGLRIMAAARVTISDRTKALETRYNGAGAGLAKWFIG